MAAKLTIRLDVNMQQAEYFQFAEREFEDEGEAQDAYAAAVEVAGAGSSEVDYISGGTKN